MNGSDQEIKMADVPLPPIKKKFVCWNENLSVTINAARKHLFRHFRKEMVCQQDLGRTMCSSILDYKAMLI